MPLIGGHPRIDRPIGDARRRGLSIALRRLRCSAGWLPVTIAVRRCKSRGGVAAHPKTDPPGVRLRVFRRRLCRRPGGRTFPRFALSVRHAVPHRGAIILSAIGCRRRQGNRRPHRHGNACIGRPHRHDNACIGRRRRRGRRQYPIARHPAGSLDRRLHPCPGPDDGQLCRRPDVSLVPSCVASCVASRAIGSLSWRPPARRGAASVSPSSGVSAGADARVGSRASLCGRRLRDLIERGAKVAGLRIGAIAAAHGCAGAFGPGIRRYGERDVHWAVAISLAVSSSAACAFLMMAGSSTSAPAPSGLATATLILLRSVPESTPSSVERTMS